MPDDMARSTVLRWGHDLAEVDYLGKKTENKRHDFSHICERYLQASRALETWRFRGMPVSPECHASYVDDSVPLLNHANRELYNLTQVQMAFPKSHFF